MMLFQFFNTVCGKKRLAASTTVMGEDEQRVECTLANDSTPPIMSLALLTSKLSVSFVSRRDFSLLSLYLWSSGSKHASEGNSL